MASSLTEVYNMALDAVGARNDISSPSEDSLEAETCNRWYPTVRDSILAAAFWPEATKADYLPLLNEQADDTWALGEAVPGFTFSYGKPADMLRPQYLSGYGRFTVMGSAINANTAQAILYYTYRNELIAQWSPQLQMAMIYGLAANICMPLTGKAQRANLMLGQANKLILEARETAANTGDNPEEPIPDWIAARGYANANSLVSRYYYPVGSLLSLSV